MKTMDERLKAKAQERRVRLANKTRRGGAGVSVREPREPRRVLPHLTGVLRRLRGRKSP